MGTGPVARVLTVRRVGLSSPAGCLRIYRTAISARILMMIDRFRIPLRSLWWAALLFAVTLTISACSLTGSDESPGDGLEFRVEAESRAPGDSVDLQLRNGTESSTYLINLCLSTLERREGVRWVAVDRGGACFLALYGLPPGDTASFRAHLPDTLSSRGLHRFTTTVERQRDNRRFDVSTNTFVIESDD